jgi:hypothetical protein
VSAPRTVAVPADQRRAELRLIGLLRQVEHASVVSRLGKRLINASLLGEVREVIGRFDRRFGKIGSAPVQSTYLLFELEPVEKARGRAAWNALWQRAHDAEHALVRIGRLVSTRPRELSPDEIVARVKAALEEEAPPT